mgnify:FL=1|jgi:hypothetical protein
MIVKICLYQTNRQPVKICDKETPCDVCSYEHYISVDKLREWSRLLAKQGIGSKQIVRKCINNILADIADIDNGQT